MGKYRFKGGQSMVEFMLALPILLFVIVGIVEFGRLTFAWMAVQNSARFGIRYAVTGEFNEIYCVQAGNQLGAAHINADTFGGDTQDCKVPDNYTGNDASDKERELIDLARLFSIQDAAVGGGAGLWLNPAVSGNYEQYLLNHSVAYIGMPSNTGFIHVTTCSNRNNQFAVDYNNHAVPLCVDNLNSYLMDDAGGPGDRVKVHVEHQHPLFMPLISNLWPSVALRAERDGIVEKFRTSRSLGVSGPILSAPTWTQTPTITDTPTITPTTTPSLTPSPTNTPIPVQCDSIQVVNSYVGPWMAGFHIASVTIRNNNPVPIHLYTANQNWQKNVPGRSLWAARFNGSPWEVIDDVTPPTSWNPSPEIEMGPGAQGDYIAVFNPQFIGLEGNTTVNLIFDDGCQKGVSVNMPTSTASATPTETSTPTITPTPDCSKYALGNFSFQNWAIQKLHIRNNDVVSANLTSIELTWDYAEQLGAANGFNNLNVDWFKWAGSYMPGHDQAGTRDYSSSTTWSGSVPFNAGGDYIWEIDFDGDWGGGGPLSGVQNSDFGVIAHFDNGCSLARNPVPRIVNTWTPSPTPSITPTPTPPPPPTSTPLPTSTALPTNTPLPSVTPSKTWTPSITPTASYTPVPTHTSWPSNTPVDTNTPIPSITPIPPTATPKTPTATSSPAPTFTPSPTWNTD